MKSEERRIYVMSEENHSRTGHGDHRPTLKVQYGLPKSYVTLHIKVGLLVSVPRPPATSEGIYSPLQRGGDGAVCSVYLAGVAARYLLFFSL